MCTQIIYSHVVREQLQYDLFILLMRQLSVDNFIFLLIQQTQWV